MPKRSQRSNDQYGFEKQYQLKQNRNDLTKQIAELTMENKKLLLQLATAKGIIDQIRISKAKYKDKYKKIKKQLEQERHKNHSSRVRLHRQKSGKIYRQGQSSKSQNSQNKYRMHSRVGSGLGCKNPLDGAKNYNNQNPYGIGNQTKLEQLTKISTSVQQMSKVLMQINTGSEHKERQLMQFIRKMDQIEQKLAQSVQEIKSHIFSFKLMKQNPGSNQGLNQNQKIKRQPNFQKIETNLTSSERNQEAGKNQNCEDSFEEIKKSPLQKLKKSKSHDSLDQLKAKGKNQNKKSESQSQSTRSKWEMLNFIGKRLENFKFQKYNSSSQLLDPDDEAEFNKVE